GRVTLERPDAQAIVVFGASGDLAKKKILPALYNLFVEDYLPERFVIVGYSFSDWSDDDFRAHAKDAVGQFSRTGIDGAAWDRFAPSLSFVSGKFDDAEAMRTLAGRLANADADVGTDGGRLYYLATPPPFFPVIATGLGAMPGGPGDPDRTRIV